MHSYTVKGGKTRKGFEEYSGFIGKKISFLYPTKINSFIVLYSRSELSIRVLLTYSSFVGNLLYRIAGPYEIEKNRKADTEVVNRVKIVLMLKKYQFISGSIQIFNLSVVCSV